MEVVKLSFYRKNLTYVSGNITIASGTVLDASGSNYNIDLDEIGPIAEHLPKEQVMLHLVDLLPRVFLEQILFII